MLVTIIKCSLTSSFYKVCIVNFPAHKQAKLANIVIEATTNLIKFWVSHVEAVVLGLKRNIWALESGRFGKVRKESAAVSINRVYDFQASRQIYLNVHIAQGVPKGP